MSNSAAPRQAYPPSRSLYLPSSFYEGSLEEDGRSNSRQDSTNYEGHTNRLSSPFSLGAQVTVSESPPSHFSPSTPAVEKGFGPYDRGENGMCGGSPDGSPGAQSQCGHDKRKFRNNILLVVFVAFMLVLVTNVIFIDVRIVSMGRPFNHEVTIHQGTVRAAQFHRI